LVTVITAIPARDDGPSAAHTTSHSSRRFVSRELFVMAFDLTSKTLRARSGWAEIWHLWTVIVPRRSINGQLVYGKVWRRHDGRDWIYKKFTEYSDDEAA
jgi:hypothetical protein